MGSLKSGMAMERIKYALSTLTVEVKLDNSRGRTDINKDAEDFYCGLLNIVLGKNLKNLNLLDMNFPAIDLADRKGKLCVQVTSTNERDKIEHTLEKFYEGILYGVPLTERFDRLIVLIIGDKPKYRKPFDEKNGFRFDIKEDIWDREHLLNQIANLPPKKLKAVERYLSENLDRYKPAPPLINLPPQTALVNKAFVGRKKELREIGKQFEKQQFVTLSGLGGIGKTELAVQFAKNHWDGNAYYVRFVTDWRQTVLEHVAPKIQGLDQELEDPEQIYQAAMQELEKCSEQDLLIVDNADQSNGTAEIYRALSSLQMKILITTRVPALGAIPIKEMGNGELYRIFKRHGAKLDKSAMDRLIAAVQGHTMTVDLIARTLVSPWCRITGETMFEAMAKSAMEKHNYPNIEADYYCSPEQPKFYGYLQALFRLQELLSVEKRILSYATLFPVNGISLDLLESAIQEEERAAIENVSARGWIQCEDKMVTIHPVIRLVCREELKPTDEMCSKFLNGILDQDDGDEDEIDWEKYTQMAAIFTEASRKLQDSSETWANIAGYLWHKVSEFQKALECLQRRVEKLEELGSDLFKLSDAYVNVGRAHHYLGDYQEALRCKRKGLDNLEKVSSDDDLDYAEDYAKCYGALSNTYGELGRYEEELDYALKAMRLQERIQEEYDGDLATYYNDVGIAYGHQGKHYDALKYQFKSLEIRYIICAPDDPELASSYNDVGVTFGKLLEHQRALEYKLKALEIRKKRLRNNDPDLARSYSGVAWSYHDMGALDKAEEHMRQAAEIICRTSLLESHPDRVNYPKWEKEFEKQKLVMEQTGD